MLFSKPFIVFRNCGKFVGNCALLCLTDNFCQLGIKGGDYESLLFKPCKDRYGGGGVYFGFQVTGMIGGFCGFERFDSGIFLG